jgi:tRNA threonylcarbamoyladenosine biosynthesis protein TsaB
MNTLAIDSITATLAVTAMGPSGKVTISLEGGPQHAESLISLIEKATLLAGFSPKETEIVSCAEGPGSFTGLRIAYAAAKGIVLASNARFVPVPTLLCYAETFASWPGVVISALDAKKDRFYLQVFRRGTAVTEPMDASAADITGFIDPAERILVTGPDADYFAETLSAYAPSLDLVTVQNGKSGISGQIAEVANAGWSGYTESMPDHAGPVYVRKSDAESNTAAKKA